MIMHIERVTECRLAVTDEVWPFAVARRGEIEAHWVEAIAANPTLFDGEVFVMPEWGVADGILTGRLLPTPFSAYHYWRETGFAGPPCSEAFATTMVEAADGGFLIAVAATGSLNGGRYVTPGGLLDRADIDDEGLMDFASAAARELREETGLGEADLERIGGFVLAPAAPLLGVASIFRARLDGAALIEKVQDFLAGEEKPELHSPRLVHRQDQLAGLAFPETTRLLLESHLV